MSLSIVAKLAAAGSLLCGFTLFSVGTALAADGSDPSVELVVTGQKADTQAASGTKTDTPLVETPQTISVIDRQDLDLRVAEDLNQALHYTAGVGPDTRGNTAGRYDQQTLRGFSPDQYLDGLRLIQSANGYAIPQIDIDTLERVEVVKGPASVLYGEASPGGIIALSSKLPTLDRFGEISVGGGSYGTLNGAFDIGGKVDESGRFAFRLDGEARRSNTQISHSLAERYGVNPSLTWRPDDKTSWTLLYSYQHDPKGGDYGAMPVQGSLLFNPTGQIPRNFYSGEPAYERFDRTQDAITSLFKRELGWGDWVFRSNARFMRTETSYRSVYHFGFFPPDLSTLNRSVALADEGVDSLTLDNQLAGTIKTGPLTHTIVIGVDYQHTGQTEAAGFGGTVGALNAFDPVYGSVVIDPAISFSVRLNLQQTGVYAQDQIAFGGFRLVLSGRNDWVQSQQYDRINKAMSSLDPNKFTGRAGLLYLFPNGLAPYLSYSTSFQPQTATDRTGKILAPTEGQQAEVGIKYQPGFWDTMVTASLYDLRETNVATQDPSAPLGLGSIAAGEVRSRGVELEGATKPATGLELKASYTYLDNMVTKDNSGLLGSRPYGVPQQTANGFGIYTLQSGWLAGFGVGGGVRYLGHNFNGIVGGAAAGELKIPGATLFDLLARYDFARLNAALKGLTLNLDASNLLDKRYISSCYSTVWCWYGAGRDVEATLRYRW